LVRIKVFSKKTNPSSLLTVVSSSVRSSIKRRRCLGVLWRLIGQNRSPLPPAITNAKILAEFMAEMMSGEAGGVN
jgi:hypothetical protein